MPENPSTDHPPVHPEVAYEKSDVRVAPVAALLALLVVGGVLTHFGMTWFFDVLQADRERAQLPVPALAAEKRLQFPRDLDRVKEPRLQKSQSEDLEKFRRKEETRLETYDWVDKDKGVVRIPVAEAMKLLADPKFAKARGMRVRPKGE
jgi:hypothetical protein